MDPSWEAAYCVTPASEVLIAGGDKALLEERVAKFSSCCRRNSPKWTGPFCTVSYRDDMHGLWVGRGAAAM